MTRSHSLPLETFGRRLLAGLQAWSDRATWSRYAFEFLMFGLKQAWACLFGGAMLALLVGTHLWWPDHAPVARYDVLVIGALGIQAAMLAFKLESWDEARVILLDARHISTLAGRHTEWATLRSRILLEQTLRQAQREEERLTRSSKERYEALLARSPEVVSQLTQREIARYLGISEVTMSRLMARRGGRRAASRKPVANVSD